MHFPTRLAARFPRGTFADYDTAAAAVRAALGLARLAPRLAAEVRSAVARHVARTVRTAVATTLMARLRETLRSATEDAVIPFTDHHRSKGDASVRVTIGDTPHSHVSAPTKWVSGRGGFGHVVTDTAEYITVCPAWRRRILARGLARLDGMLTTHATPVLADGDIAVYRAAWVRQKAGYNLAAETGYLAFHAATGTAFHVAAAWGLGYTDQPARRSLRGLRRKLALQSPPTPEKLAARDARARKRDERRAAALAKLAGQLARLDVSDPAIGAVVVTRADSLRAGNCEPGTDEFIDRFLPGRTSATVAEIAAGLRRADVATLVGADLTLARQLGAAVLAAVRRDRNARRLILA